MATVGTERWSSVDKLLLRESALAPPGFEPCPEIRDFLHNTFKILCIGAGGLGCEILKDLALSGFGNIHVIDMDTIDLSNLNRQFLFRKKDIGKYKSEVAAEFINKRVKGVTVTSHVGKIQDKDLDFYRSFNVVVAGLDSIEARRWINSTLASLVEMGEDGEPDLSTMIPLIDGGTEGFKGQARVILPHVTPCFECTINTFPKQTRFAICTLANTPRQPEHCIEWAMLLHWPSERPGDKLDGDDPEHVQWIFDAASKRASEFNIKGVTYMLSQGVIKNIIPAIASTNAVIAGICSLEAFKIATSCAPFLSNYMFYNAGESVYSHTFEYEKDPECPVCSTTPRSWTMSSKQTLQDFIDRCIDDGSLQLTRPSVRAAGKTLYMAAPPVLEKATRVNLSKTLGELVTSACEIDVTDPAINNGSLRFILHLQGEDGDSTAMTE